MDLVFKYFWVAFVASAAVNGWGLWKRSEPIRRERPETTGVFRGAALWMVLGWGGVFTLLGIEIAVGWLDSFHDGLRPRSGGLPAQVFLGALFLNQVGMAVGLMRANVAETLAQHPQIQGRMGVSPRGIRIIAWISVPFFALWLIGLYAMDVAAMGQ